MAEFCSEVSPAKGSSIFCTWAESFKVKTQLLRNFTRKLNDLWKILAREFVEQVQETPDRFPVLPVANPFIVPGGSFQIYFYWDSYWINKG